MSTIDHPSTPTDPRPRRPWASLRELRALADGTLVGAAAVDAVEIRDVTHDSRDAGPGVLFAARPGVVTDGHRFAPVAVDRGSPALLVERELALPVPQVLVDSVARRLGDVAAAVHGHPSRDLAIAGITGTNGKTTCAALVEGVCAAAGMRTGLIGTVGTRIGDDEIAGVRTTPESTDLQRLFRRMVDAGVETLAMEVSSHGLALGRANGTRFAVAAFTNLTRDHLDFHGSMEEYFAAKAQLFEPERSAAAVVNVDDRWGRRLAARTALPLTTVSTEDAAADVVGSALDVGPDGTALTVTVRGRRLRVHIGLAGRFNVTNALVTLGVVEALGVDPAVAAEALRRPRQVPGRMERIDRGQPFTVLVDYAHTPDSLTRALDAARELADGRVLVVVGCGGERDRGKRPAMGATAVAGADRVVFTDDNPRSEDPRTILDEIVAGARTVGTGRWTVVPDRRAAIGAALHDAEPGDVVLVAGKGHERGQQVADATLPFDDRQVVGELLGELARGRRT